MDLIVSTPLAALVLGTSEGNLRKMRSQNAGPDYVKVGPHVLYTVSALSAYSGREFSLSDVQRCALQLIANPEDAPRELEIVEFDD